MKKIDIEETDETLDRKFYREEKKISIIARWKN